MFFFLFRFDENENMSENVIHEIVTPLHTFQAKNKLDD